MRENVTGPYLERTKIRLISKRTRGSLVNTFTLNNWSITIIKSSPIYFS